MRNADLIELCAPVAPVAAEIGPHLKSGAIATDVCSTKVSAIRDLVPNLPAGVHLMPLHGRYTPRIALNARNA